MKGNIKDYFDFRKSERAGTIILVLIILVTLFIPELFKRHHQEKVGGLEYIRLESEEVLIDSNSRKVIESRTYVKEEHTASKTSKYHPVIFNPNSLDREGWMRMGFSQKQAEVIIKYRHKIGEFTTKDDFRRIYIIDEVVYNIFEPYINIEPMTVQLESPKVQVNVPRKPLYRVELNSADSLELVMIKGVGPVYARRIIEYRQKLHGFTNIMQLSEIYGMDSLKTIELADQVFIDTTLISRINVNTASLNDLRSHPYIGYYIAKAIVDYRIQSGKISSLDQLKRVRSISPELFYKIKPYLSIN